MVRSYIKVMNMPIQKKEHRLNSVDDFLVKADAKDIALAIIETIFARRCLVEEGNPNNCRYEDEIAPHLDTIIQAVNQQQPIVMILPAFPGKSPNRKKTLSHLPDYAELYALDNLHELCQDIRRVYQPGAVIGICSDGYVFSDVVRIPDRQVKAYTDVISDYCTKKYPGMFFMYDLIDTYPGIKDLDSLREELMIQYGTSLLALKSRVKEEPEAASMYRGVTRFLCEDYGGMEEFAGVSNAQIQKVARVAAYRVIQRSEAWSKHLEEKFPQAVRLSIHPQFRISKKIGIKLAPVKDRWRTPWHSVAVKRGADIYLEKRSNVDERQYHLIFKSGRPFHYVSTQVSAE
ncbi:pyoverdine biosynthesis protein PvcA [Dickeya undicola]|uniref:Pyoverdine biosynthesis protein PvcA n=2 Tax=Dickeya undicola TaxID=1577887 RepID=A0A3N0G4M5_9GAMM|nr:pyoverdine biosynthesis protein PvcA [Dickeya undicola]RNM28534.1 pyoverdine biosynthesis protein PvcA [Dickeya undicola]